MRGRNQDPGNRQLVARVVILAKDCALDDRPAGPPVMQAEQGHDGDSSPGNDDHPCGNPSATHSFLTLMFLWTLFLMDLPPESSKLSHKVEHLMWWQGVKNLERIDGRCFLAA